MLSRWLNINLQPNPQNPGTCPVTLLPVVTLVLTWWHIWTKGLHTKTHLPMSHVLGGHLRWLIILLPPEALFYTVYNKQSHSDACSALIHLLVVPPLTFMLIMSAATKIHISTDKVLLTDWHNRIHTGDIIAGIPVVACRDQPLTPS